MTFDFDQYGLIVQTNGDGGDSPARTGLYYFLEYMLDNTFIGTQLAFSHAMDNMQVAPGVLIRNPVNYNQPSDVSRDQTNPVCMALGKYPNEHKLLRLLAWKIFTNFSRYPNGDIAQPDSWCTILRALGWWWFYPLFFLGDLFTLANSIIRCIQGRDPNNVGDDINHGMTLWNALRYPTPISWLARKVYVRFRPFGVQYAWDWYFRPSTFANPFNELAKPLIRRYFT